MGKRGMVFLIFFVILGIFLISFTSAIGPTFARYSGCSDSNLSTGGKPCVQITSCQTLPNANTYYLLMNDIYSDFSRKDCFDLMSGIPNSVVDLNNFTVYYANFQVPSMPNFDFEIAGSTPDLAEGWDFSQGPNLRRYYGDFYHGDDYGPTLYTGDYSIKADFPTLPEESITSTNTVTLNPGIEYVFSGYVFNLAGVSQDIRSRAELIQFVGEVIRSSDNAVLASFIQNGQTWRGFQYVDSNPFSVSSPTQVKFRIRILNADISGVSGNYGVYFDRVQLLAYRYRGLRDVLYVSDYSNLNDHCVYKNGRFKQVLENCYQCDAILGIGDYSEVKDIETFTKGVESRGIRSNTYFSNIHNNNISGNVTTVVSRDNAFGLLEVRGDTSGKTGGDTVIHDNFVLGSPQYGILTPGGGSNFTIYNNVIIGNTRYVQGFGISAGFTNGKVYNNYINLSSGRGIHASGRNVEIYNNTVQVAEQRFQEEGTLDGSTGYGIQIEVGQNNNIHDNNVIAITHENYGNAVGLRITDEYGSNLIHNNNFTALLLHSGRSAYSAYFLDDNDPPAQGASNIYNNTFNSNHINFMLSGVNKFPYYFENNTFVRIGSLAEYRTFNFVNNPAGNHFIDQQFTNGASFNSFSGTSYNYDVNWSLFVRVFDGFGQGINGASVVIRNSLGNIISSKSTVNGYSLSVLREYVNTNGVKTYSNVPYNVSVIYSGQTQYKTTPLNETTTLTFFFGGQSPDVNSDGVINVVDLAIVVYNQGRKSTDANWANYDHLDLNEDNIVNWQDVQIIVNGI